MYLLLIFLHACNTFENHILDVFSPKVKCKAYLIVFLVTVVSVSFPPISAEGNENLFHCFARCTNMVVMDHFHKLAKYPGLIKQESCGGKN